MKCSSEIRSKTVSVLEHHKVPIHPSLPLLDPVHIRSAGAVACKIVSLYCMTGLANGANAKKMLEWLACEGALSVLDEVEAGLLQTREFSEARINELSWKQESLYALCWCGGLVGNMNWPNQECNLSAVFHAIPPEVPIDDFLSSFVLREGQQTVEALDLYYCLHASLTHPDLWDEPQDVEQLKIEVVMERRQALEWVCSDSVSWDEIPLDT